MPLQIIRNDITKMQVDAIVNAANNTLLGGGGVDGAIHRAAGPQLLAECRTLGGCKTGDAKVTAAYSLPCRWVIHTVGPVWQGGRHGEAELLASCYRRSLELATEKGCASVAFPLISAGAYGYPAEEAVLIAEQTIQAFLQEQDLDMLVYLVVFDQKSYLIGAERFAEIKSYIDARYAAEHGNARGERTLFLGAAAAASMPSLPSESIADCFSVSESHSIGIRRRRDSAVHAELEKQLQMMDESFSEMLIRKIKEKGISEAKCYKDANIDRRLFSKIRCDKLYRPKKNTVLAFAIALNLSLEETKDMLHKAGFSLSHSNQADIIVEYYISKGNYDLMEINNALFDFDQVPIGY